MRFQTAVSLFSALAGVSAQTTTTGQLGNATVVSNNPPGALYTAVFPNDAFFKPAYPDGGNVRGSVYAQSSPDGVGVMFKVDFFNLPKEGGPFTYHLHDQPVPKDGNCTKTLAHLDPFIRGEDPACDPDYPETCQVGDLSGKYGKVQSDPYESQYVDDYTSLRPGPGSFFGNRSVVLHFANKTRITCANFAAVNPGVLNSTNGTAITATPTPTGSSSASGNATQTTSTLTATFYVAAAGRAGAPALMAVVGLAALGLLL